MSVRRARSATGRVLYAFLAAWFGFVTIQPGMADPCPHHAPALAELALGMRAAGTPGRMHVHAGMHGMHLDSPRNDPRAGLLAHRGAPSGGHGHGGGCGCLGDCSAPAIVVLVPRPHAVAFTGPVYAAEAELPPERDLPRVSAPHTLPFANGPPAAAAIIA